MDALSEKQVEKSIELLVSEDGGVFKFISSEFEPMSQKEREAFKNGFYACIKLCTELLKKLNAGELKENDKRGMEND